MKLGVPKESAPGERRVAMVPDVAKRLAAKGVEVVVEEGAGQGARIPDQLFEDAGVQVGDPCAADEFGRYFPMLMTAAGTVPPAKVLVLGAGVAGLQAVATAKRLGAQVQAFDVRSAVKEQIESLGAKFVKLDVDFDAEVEGGYARELTAEEQDKQRQAL